MHRLADRLTPAPQCTNTPASETTVDVPHGLDKERRLAALSAAGTPSKVSSSTVSLHDCQHLVTDLIASQARKVQSHTLERNR